MTRFVCLTSLLAAGSEAAIGFIKCTIWLTGETASTLNSLDNCMPRRLSSVISAINTTANGSFRHPGRLVFRWVIRSGKSWVPFLLLTLWSGLAARRLLERALCLPRALCSFSSLRGRCLYFWPESCLVVWSVCTSVCGLWDCFVD